LESESTTKDSVRSERHHPNGQETQVRQRAIRPGQDSSIEGEGLRPVNEGGKSKANTQNKHARPVKKIKEKEACHDKGSAWGGRLRKK